jgi:hypothetical protein
MLAWAEPLLHLGDVGLMDAVALRLHLTVIRPYLNGDLAQHKARYVTLTA